MHNDQAQPRRVSGIGWTDGLCGLATTLSIPYGLAESLLASLATVRPSNRRIKKTMTNVREDTL